MSSSSESSSTVFTNHSDPQLSPPQRLDPFAIVAFLLGVFSALALLGREFWACAGIGMMGCALIVIRMNRQRHAKSGVSLAMVGLALTITMATLAPTRHYLRTLKIRQQASVIGEDWLRSIISNRAYVALAALEMAENRLVDSQLEKFYRGDDQNRASYEQFVNRELIRALIALNGRARIQCYGTEDINSANGKDVITNIFSVSYLETPTDRKTFFVRLVLERTDNPVSTTGFWRVKRYRGGVRPRI